MQIDLSSNIEDVLARLDGISKRAIPFATALALTRTAKAAQAKVVRNLPRRFKIRTPWVAKGIRIVPVNKADVKAGKLDALSVTVFSKDDFMVLQEEGGTKHPTGGHHLAVPASAVPRTPRGLIRKRDRPRKVLDRYGVFKAPLKAGSPKLGIFRRKARRRKRKKKYRKPAMARPAISLLYVLADQAQVAQRFGMAEMVASAAARKFEGNFVEALEQSIATDRVGSVNIALRRQWRR